MGRRRERGRLPAFGRAAGPWWLAATLACRAAPLSVDIPLDPSPASMLVRLGPPDELGSATLFDFDPARVPALPALAEYGGEPLEVEAVGFAEPLAALGLPPGSVEPVAPADPTAPAEPSVGLPTFLWARGADVRDGQVGPFVELALLDPPLSNLRLPSPSPAACTAMGGCVWSDGDLRCVDPCPATSSPAAPAEAEAAVAPSFAPCPTGWTFSSGARGGHCEPGSGLRACTAADALQGRAGFPGRQDCESVGGPRLPPPEAFALSPGVEPTPAAALAAFGRLFLEVGEHTLGATVSIARPVVIEGELPTTSRLADGTLRVESGGDLLLTNLRLDRLRIVVAAGGVARLARAIVGEAAPDLIVVEPGGALLVERVVAVLDRGPLATVAGSASFLDFSAFGSDVVVARGSGGHVELTQVRLVGGGVTAIALTGGRAELTRVAFYGEGGGSRGAVEAEDAEVRLTDVVFDGRSEPGLVTVRGGSLAIQRFSTDASRAPTIDAHGTTVAFDDGLLAAASGSPDAAALRFGGGRVTLSRLLLSGFLHPVIEVSDAELAAQDLVITDTVSTGLVLRRASGSLERITAAAPRGVVLDLADSTFSLRDLQVGPARGQSTALDGVHLARSTLRAERVRLRGLRGEGVFAVDGSTLELYDFDAADVVHPILLDASSLVGARLFVADAEELGVHAIHRSTVRLEDVVVQDTRRRVCEGGCDSPPRAGALGAYCGSSAAVERFRFRRLELAGAYVGHDSSLLLADGLITEAPTGLVIFRPFDQRPRALSDFLRGAGLLDVDEGSLSFVPGGLGECP